MARDVKTLAQAAKTQKGEIVNIVVDWNEPDADEKYETLLQAVQQAEQSE